jgi:hypothetical protein
MKTSRQDGVAIEALRKEAQTKGTAGARRAGLKMLEKMNVNAPINDLGYKELQLYLEYVKSWDYYYGSPNK